MAAAPAIVQFVGGVPADALRYTQLMYEITLAESAAYRIPALNFRGTPTGIHDGEAAAVPRGAGPRLADGRGRR